MNPTIVGIFIVPSILGHFALWISLWNRVQAYALPLWIIEVVSTFYKAACGIIPFLILGVFCFADPLAPVSLVTAGYLITTSVIALAGIPMAVARRRHRKVFTKLKRQTSRVETVSTWKDESVQNAGLLTRALLSIPGNQVVELEENTKEIEIPNLPRSLDQISIGHLTDLHFTGKISRAFFERAIESVNQMDADIVAITGDLIDKVEYTSWLPMTLGKLTSKHGVFAILGNHDCKHNIANLRLMLGELGITCISGMAKEINIRGQRVLIAGNELPWIAPAADMEAVDGEEYDLKVLLSHSPDQIEWARYYGFDLMLAGHTHGGQFCVPWYGPVACPSRLPLDYASGTIFEPPTVLHVSRGLSAEIPLRLNCRPEVTKLVLQCPVESKDENSDSFSKAKDQQHNHPSMNASLTFSNFSSPSQGSEVNH